MVNDYLRRYLRSEWIYAYFVRGIVRILTLPLSYLGESTLKRWFCRKILRFQNSLPIELAVSRGEIAVQIGTPLPRTVRRFRKAVGNSGRVIVFEAEPTNFRRLENAVTQNGFANVTLIEGAAWRESGEIQLAVSPYMGDHKISLDDVRMDNDLCEANRDMQMVNCKCHSIDDVMAEQGINAIDYLSVTVNGAELEVLRGAEQILRRSPNPRVYAKGHATLASGRPLNEAIREYLESLGFVTMKTRGEPSSTNNSSWLWRAGDVYAWKKPKTSSDTASVARTNERRQENEFAAIPAKR